MPAHRVDTSREAAVAQGGEEYAAEVWSKLPRCSDCDRPMRAQSQSREAFPATVIKASKGYCNTHYNARSQKRSLPGDRKIDRSPTDASERQDIASRWSETERNTALAVCSLVTEPKEAYEVMSMLGLFDDDPRQITTDLSDPKGIAHSRY